MVEEKDLNYVLNMFLGDNCIDGCIPHGPCTKEQAYVVNTSVCGLKIDNIKVHVVPRKHIFKIF